MVGSELAQAPVVEFHPTEACFRRLELKIARVKLHEVVPQTPLARSLENRRHGQNYRFEGSRCHVRADKNGHVLQRVNKSGFKVGCALGVKRP